MTNRDDATDDRLQALLRALGNLDFDEEVDAVLRKRGDPDYAHPARYDLESYAVEDISNEASRAEIELHLMECAVCRMEVGEFRVLQPTDKHPAERFHVCCSLLPLRKMRTTPKSFDCTSPRKTRLMPRSCLRWVYLRRRPAARFLEPSPTSLSGAFR